MKRLLISVIFLFLFLALVGCSAEPGLERTDTPQIKSELVKLDGTTVSTAELEAFIAQVMEKADVAGLSLAIINNSQISYQKAFGYKDNREGMLNNDQTIFSAASFSKPVFAYLVMILREEGLLDLDRPLYQYLEKPLYEYPAYTDLQNDERYQQITARMVLSHTTGFPNWRFLEPDGRLKFLFSPGEKYSYSGEGITLLQMVVEEITGSNLEALAQERIFQPFEMTRSSYIWQTKFEDNYAAPHDEYGRQRGENIQRSVPDAAGSMVTTAGDYARFLVGILNTESQRKATAEEMLQPQISIPYRHKSAQSVQLAWSLGWGRFDSPYGQAFFHTGHSLGWQNYTVTYVDKGIGIVMLSNSDNFESVAEEIANMAIGDIYSPYDWLGYVTFDPTLAKKTPPPDPVAIQVDPEILATYAGTYDMQPTAIFLVKFEENALFLKSQDGQEWLPLLAESETHFFVNEQEDYRFIFVKDNMGTVSALQVVYHGLKLPLASKEK